jgi:hypothetical protein
MISECRRLKLSDQLLSFFGALFLILPTYLSIKGATFISLFSFLMIIILNNRLYSNISVLKIFTAIIFFLIYINIYLVFDFNYHGVYKTLMISLTCLVCFLISLSIPNINYFLTKVAEIISFCGLFVLLTIFLKGFSLSVNDRLSVGIINPIWLGRFAGMAILIIYQQKNIRFKIFFLIVNLIIIFLSGSKGPIIGLLVVGLFHHFNTKKLIVSFFVILIFILYFFNVLNDDIRIFITSRFLSLNPNSTDLFQEIEDDRLSIITRSSSNYLQSVDFTSFLFGLGPNKSSFYYYKSVISERWYPHNIFLEILFEYGVIALLLFAYTLFKTQMFKSSMLNGLIIFFLINSLFSGDLPLNWLLCLFIILKFVRS